MPRIKYCRALPLILFALLIVLPTVQPANAQGQRDRAAEKSKAITPAEAKKLEDFLQRRFSGKVSVTQDKTDKEALRVTIGSELLGWIRRDDDDVAGDRDFLFEWYILELELDE